MSINCTKCITKPRTGIDLLCDYCRQKDKEMGIYPFPIQEEGYEKPRTYIPWWIAQEAYKYYVSKFGTHQSMERLSNRGGFGRKELLVLLRKEI